MIVFVSIQDLKDYMRQAGEVTYADAHRDRKNEGLVKVYTWFYFLRMITVKVFQGKWWCNDVHLSGQTHCMLTSLTEHRYAS